MKVLLTHGYFIKEDLVEQKIMKPYPPLGILYLSSYLSQHGVNNKIFDSTFSSKEELKQYLLRERPEYIAIYINLMTKLNVLEIIRFLKSSNELKGSKIILGGPEVRYNSEDLLKHGADCVVIGEGEHTLLELVQTLDGKKTEDLSKVNGIGYINFDGVTFTPERSLISSLDDLPLPDRQGINIKDYQSAWKERHKQDAVSVSTMRGCPYTCRWCSRAVYGLSYRRRSPKKVVEELRIIKESYNPDSIWFVDDVFTVSHLWLNEFNEELKKHDVKINYECITRSDRMNEDVLRIMKESGCFRVWIGAESGSQKVIDAMDRRINVNQMREMIKLTKKKGIEAGTFIMLGYPGETEKDIEETIYHLKKSNPDHFTITVAYPIKGTEFYEEVEQIGEFQWDKQTDRERDFKRTYPRKYYNYAVQRVHSEFSYYKLKSENQSLSVPAIKFKIKSILAKARMQLVKATAY